MSEEKVLNEILGELKLQRQAILKNATQTRPLNSKKIGPIDVSIASLVASGKQIAEYELPGPIKGIWIQASTNPDDTVYLVTDELTDNNKLNALPVKSGQVVTFDELKAKAWLCWGDLGVSSSRNQPFPESLANSGEITVYVFLDGKIDTNIFQLGKGIPSNITQLDGKDCATNPSVDVDDQGAQLITGISVLSGGLDRAPVYTLCNLGPNTVYVGDVNVVCETGNASPDPIGIPLVIGEKMTFRNLADLYGICNATETALVVIMEENWD